MFLFLVKMYGVGFEYKRSYEILALGKG